MGVYSGRLGEGGDREMGRKELKSGRGQRDRRIMRRGDVSNIIIIIGRKRRRGRRTRTTTKTRTTTTTTSTRRRRKMRRRGRNTKRLEEVERD